MKTSKSSSFDRRVSVGEVELRIRVLILLATMAVSALPAYSQFPEIPALKPVYGAGADKLKSYIGNYVVGKRCLALGYTFTESEINNIDLLIKELLDGSSVSQEKKDAIWQESNLEADAFPLNASVCSDMYEVQSWYLPKGTLSSDSS